MEFTKVQGLGNDFVVIDCRDGALQEKDYAETSVRLCDRHFGIGADGLLLVLNSEVADIRMRIINSDGSEAEMCGNGIRCFAKYVYDEKIVAKETMTVETGAGILIPKMLIGANGMVDAVEVDMGEPILSRKEIPMTGEEAQAIATPIVIEEKEWIVTGVSMGNPHCVIFVEDISAVDLPYWGPRIERSAYFPKKTNVEFVQVVKEDEVIMRVWERGAAVTLACGTGSCATTVAAVLNGKCTRNVLLHLDGGDLQVRWDENTNHLFMTGAAVEVFRGQI